MSKIWLMSDLHQEYAKTIYGRHPLTRFDPALAAPASFDVVVVCGDASVQLAAAIDWLADRFAGARVVYIPGNHDYYCSSSADIQTVSEILNAGRERAYKRGITLLSDDIVDIAGIRFIGSTLWSDFCSIGSASLSEKIRRASGRNGLADYRLIWQPAFAHQNRAHRRLRPEDTIVAHFQSRLFIAEALKTPFHGPTVVATHHAPHSRSLDISSGGDLDYCFASDLGHLLVGENAPAAWLHGHIHQFRDYRIGACRLVCNPRGYAFADGYAGTSFDPGFVITL
ncbi:metallophosphoesterase [Devosia sp. BK]|uniref:metallophosphoesterase n=1 Tax=Devosia sp. BK TaxID=2871706 RepID=UPI00293B3E91|nr:metallophosphoesterase [Devosia sp. BK]MDV3253693.1 metallophosphoesterase [Devosia sp. BK]